MATRPAHLDRPARSLGVSPKVVDQIALDVALGQERHHGVQGVANRAQGQQVDSLFGVKLSSQALKKTDVESFGIQLAEARKAIGLPGACLGDPQETLEVSSLEVSSLGEARHLEPPVSKRGDEHDPRLGDKDLKVAGVKRPVSVDRLKQTNDLVLNLLRVLLQTCDHTSRDRALERKVTALVLDLGLPSLEVGGVERERALQSAFECLAMGRSVREIEFKVGQCLARLGREANASPGL